MKLHFEFDNLDQIDEFAEAWFRGRVAQVERYDIRVGPDSCYPMASAAPDKPDPRGPDTRPITAEGAVIPTGAGQSAQEAASAPAGEAPKTDPAPETAPKRKRRTKAEIAADEAAAKAAQEAADVAALRAGVEQDLKAALVGDCDPAGVAGPYPLDNLKPEPVDNPPDPSPEIVALAATIDGSDKMAHMNEGRDFIAKHGFPKYNETFALADVSTNIAAHTPEQAAMHRAAMQWLIAQAGVK